MQELEFHLVLNSNNMSKIIVIDPGHGRLQPGKRSPFFEYKGYDVQFEEWEFNRDVAEMLGYMLKERRVNFLKTLPDTWNWDNHLEHSVGIINNLCDDYGAHNVFFVSIHANAASGQGWSNASGVETLYYSAEREAAIFQKHILDYLAPLGFKDRGIKQRKGLYILKKTKCKGVITENGFYTNKEEVLHLMNPEVRYLIAEAHANAIMEILQI